MLYYAYKIVIDCGIRAPGHGKYVVDGLKNTEKGFFTMLTTNVQLSSASTNNSQMVMHTETSDTDISIARVFQKYFSDTTSTNGLIHYGKDSKRDIKRKWVEREYHIQDNKYVQHKSVNMSYSSMQFHAL